MTRSPMFLPVFVFVLAMPAVGQEFKRGDRAARPAKITVPPGMEKAPGPWNDPDDATVWPNTRSRANGDSWLIENHDRIRVLRPRLLLINFSNEHSRSHLDRLAAQLIDALAESSRPHGYRKLDVPAFLRYEIFKFVDLRDANRIVADSRKMPAKQGVASGINMEYVRYFSDEFAAHYDVPDPRDPGRKLKLDELLDGGYVHEVWFFVSGSPEAKVGAYEVVEEKPRYDERFRPIAGEWVQAGNGGDADQPWTGRSCRIGCVNASRGAGCFLESLGHGLEGMAESGAIPYFTRYFREFAGFDLKRRYGLPFESLYDIPYGGNAIEYPDETTMSILVKDRTHRVKDYVPIGGNVHFPPNGRRHYDLDNDRPVLSTIEDWRIGSGPNGKDLKKPFTNAVFVRYRARAPDCMGPWLIYWRQNMPGPDSRARDDDGKPMKNWWPFLFY